MMVKAAIVVPLHLNWKYLDDCCQLMNEEWPRSTTARMHNLKASRDNLPTSLILLSAVEGSTKELVVGHSKLSAIPSLPNACFIESVVIAKKLRGQGWGRFIMLETEKYAKTKGKSMMYLSTKDKKDFYHKLGYSECAPVSIYGGGIGIKNCAASSILGSGSVKSSIKTENIVPPPPPLPPEPDVKLKTKSYMQKFIM